MFRINKDCSMIGGVMPRLEIVRTLGVWPKELTIHFRETQRHKSEPRLIA
jgi:hypothetical protein